MGVIVAGWVTGGEVSLGVVALLDLDFSFGRRIVRRTSHLFRSGLNGTNQQKQSLHLQFSGVTRGRKERILCAHTHTRVFVWGGFVHPHPDTFDGRMRCES